MLKIRASQIILGAAVFDDILGMVLLAIVVSLAAGGGIQWLHLGVVLAEAVGFTFFMIYVGPRFVRRMEPGLKHLSTQEAPLAGTRSRHLPIALGGRDESWHGGYNTGAFFAGLIFSDYAPVWELKPRVEGINEFLSPFFFFTMGARWIFVSSTVT